MASFAQQWHKLTPEQKEAKRESLSLSSRINQVSRELLEDERSYIVNGVPVSFPSKIRAIESLLNHTFGIKVEIEQLKPLRYYKSMDSKPITANERFAVVANQNAHNILTSLSSQQWGHIYQLVQKAAYDKESPDPQAKEILVTLAKLVK